MQTRAAVVNISEAIVSNHEALQKRRSFLEKQRPFLEKQRPFSVHIYAKRYALTPSVSRQPSVSL